MRKFLSILTLFSFVLISGCKSDNTIESWKAGSANDDVFIPMSQQDLNALKKEGLDYVEVDWYKAPKENTKEWAIEVKKRTDKTGIRIWSVHLPFSTTYDISSVDESTRLNAIERNIQDMELSASTLKPTYFVIHPSLEPIADEERPSRITSCKKSLQVLAQKAKELHCVLLVENLPRTCLGNTADELIELLQTDETLGICFDVNHLMKESHASFIRKTGDKIKSTHMSDYDFINEKHWLPGEGLIDWDKLFDELLNVGYPGPFIFEPNHGEKPNAPSIQAMGERWRDLKQNYKDKGNVEKNNTAQIKVLQLNIWQETTLVESGFKGLVDLIKQTNPDVAMLCEIRNYKGEAFIPKLVQALKNEGYNYDGESLDLDVGILSKHKLDAVESAFVLPNNSRPILKASINVNGQTFVFYSAHLDYTHYECYLPRGYNGTTWKKMDQPVLNADSILTANRIAWRDEAILAFLSDAEKEIRKGSAVILGGDFNEPSHLDWQIDTKDLRDHQGLVINWDCSVLLRKHHYVDAFRALFPDPVKYPGFTFPSDNKNAELKQLAWAQDADERDRIDFIYYRPFYGLTLSDIRIVGPIGTILRGERIGRDSQDVFIEPIGVWPTDHKGLLATFTLNYAK